METAITYDAPPTVASFMKSESFFRMIAGPVGSGKTTGCVFELLRRACEQPPGLDGLRYTRFAIVRQTLKQIKDTVLKDIMAWLGRISVHKVSENTVYVEFGDVRSEWLLIPLEDIEDQRRLLSSQLTGAWMSEAIEMDVELVAAIAGRCGRYPSGVRGVPHWFGIIADTNFPSIGSAWHVVMEVAVPPDWQIFKQPGGLKANAENLNWLTQTEETLKLPLDDPRRIAQGRLYYERLARSNNVDWVRRYVHAEYGEDPSGTAVFRESFKHSFHVAAQGIEPVHGHPLVVGQDFGRDPCSLICQCDHRGRLLVLAEVIAQDMGLENQLKLNLLPELRTERYLAKPILVVGDPAGAAKSTHYEETSFDLIKRCGLNCMPAPTNDLDPRLRAVEAFLGQQINGGPALIIDGIRCPTLVRALDGAYRYGKTRDGKRRPTPDKTHPFSDVADALQYVCLAVHGGQVMRFTGSMLRPTREFKRVPKGAWT